MNINKLVKWNMTQPYDKRISADALAERVDAARAVADANALGRQIRAEVADTLAAEHAKWDAL